MILALTLMAGWGYSGFAAEPVARPHHPKPAPAPAPVTPHAPDEYACCSKGCGFAACPCNAPGAEPCEVCKHHQAVAPDAPFVPRPCDPENHGCASAPCRVDRCTCNTAGSDCYVCRLGGDRDPHKTAPKAAPERYWIWITDEQVWGFGRIEGGLAIDIVKRQPNDPTGLVRPAPPVAPHGYTVPAAVWPLQSPCSQGQCPKPAYINRRRFGR